MHGLTQSLLLSELFDEILKPQLATAFWESINENDPRLQMIYKEANLQRNYLCHAIPIWLHGDGVEFVDGRSIMTLSWAQLLT